MIVALVIGTKRAKVTTSIVGIITGMEKIIISISEEGIPMKNVTEKVTVVREGAKTPTKAKMKDLIGRSRKRVWRRTLPI